MSKAEGDSFTQILQGLRMKLSSNDQMAGSPAGSNPVFITF